MNVLIFNFVGINITITFSDFVTKYKEAVSFFISALLSTRMTAIKIDGLKYINIDLSRL